MSAKDDLRTMYNDLWDKAKELTAENERLAQKCDALVEQVAKAEDYRIMQTLLEVRCERLRRACLMAREELVFGGDWDTARDVIGRALGGDA